MTVQTLISDSGDELVVLSRRDYDVLLARTGDEAAEDRLSAEIIARSSDALARGGDVALPEAVWEDLERPDTNTLTVLRRFRGLTETQLSKAAGVAEGDLRGYERGEATPDAEALKALARVLQIPQELLTS